MQVTRDDMIKVLKAHSVPALRELGFKGSFPHFYREISGHVDLLTFQFSMSGGRFTVEISYTTPSRDNLGPSDKSTPVAKLRAYFTNRRKRLGANGYGDHWFIFDQPFVQRGELAQEPSVIASEVARLARTEGQSWWQAMRVGS